MKQKPQRVVYVAERNGAPEYAALNHKAFILRDMEKCGCEIVEYVPRHLRVNTSPEVHRELVELTAAVKKHRATEAKPKRAAKKPARKGGRSRA